MRVSSNARHFNAVDHSDRALRKGRGTGLVRIHFQRLRSVAIQADDGCARGANEPAKEDAKRGAVF